MSTFSNIKKHRELKNYTQEYMADRLNISQNTYSKLENGGIKLTVDRLKQISEILETPIEELLSADSNIYNFNNSHIEKFYGYIETLQEDNKELTMTTVNFLQNHILHLQKENERLLSLIENSNNRKN
jgi:transcriptional regulator with XRE-family HTH domain